jgi:hypothetical protein
MKVKHTAWCLDIVNNSKVVSCFWAQWHVLVILAEAERSLEPRNLKPARATQQDLV